MGKVLSKAKDVYMALMVAFHKGVFCLNFNVFNQCSVWSTYVLNERVDAVH